MDSNSISTKTRGFTLLETVIASALASMVFVMIASISVYTSRGFVAVANYVDLDQYSRTALDRMSQDIRQADAVLSFETNGLVLSHNGERLEYHYDPQAMTLTCYKNGTSELLLQECDQLEFAIFQRNPIGGTFDQYPTAKAETCKIVQISWRCSRKILGLKVNTESVHSAKVVLRNQ